MLYYVEKEVKKKKPTKETKAEVYKVFVITLVGADIVDWLLRWSLVRNRGNGASMGQALLKLGHLQEVDLRDGTSGFSPKFSDNDKLYRFVSTLLKFYIFDFFFFYA